MTTNRWRRVLVAGCNRQNLLWMLGVILMSRPVAVPLAADSCTPSPKSNIRLIILESDAPPDELGGAYSRIESASVSETGEVAFSATLSNSTVNAALLVKSTDSTRVLLRSVDQAPVGGTYNNFREIDFSVFVARPGFEGNGTFAIFRAELEGGPVSEGVFLWTSDGVKTVAAAGGRSPRGNTYRTFSQPTVLAGVSNSGVIPLMAFVAEMADGSKSLITDNTLRDPVEILSTNDKLGDSGKEIVRDFVVSRMGGIALSVVADLRKKDKRFKESLMISADAIFQGGLKEKATIEGLGRIKRILTPPSIRFQVGYTTVEFRSGVSALAARDSFHAPVIVAQSGGPAPGLPGETIQSFGPPEINDNFPFDSGLTLLVSTVRLSGGRSALWSDIKLASSSGGPETTGARLLMIEGDQIGASQDASLGSFSAVKVNNSGAVLVRGTVRTATATREGLFVVDGLLDRQGQ